MRFAALLVLTLSLTSFATSIPAPTYAQDFSKEVTLVEVPEPSVANLEDSVRQRLEVSRADLDELLTRPESPVADLAEAYSHVGKIYLAYDLRDSAAACFENAMILMPHRWEWPYYLAVVAQKNGDFVDAEDLLERALVLKANDTPTLLRLGQVRLRLGDLQGSSWAYRRALAIDTTLAAAYYGIGQIQRSQGDLEAALQTFARALTYQPDAAGVHYQLGLTLRQLGRNEEARRHLAENRKLEAYGQRPVRFPDPLMIQANALAGGSRIRIGRCSGDLEAGRLESALIECHQALRADPSNSKARHLLAMAMAANGDLSDAERELRRVIKQDPESAFAFYNLGSILTELSREEEALEMFVEATRLESDFPEAQFAVATTLWNLGRIEETVEQLDAFLLAAPYHLPARNLRAAALLRLERWDAATAEYRLVLEKDPANPQVRVDLATLLAGSGQFEEAKSILQPTLEIDLPQALRPLALSTMAGIDQHLGNFDAAIAGYRQALAIDPGLPDGYFNLGSALLAAGDSVAAAEAFARSLELDPGDERSLTGEVQALLQQSEWAQALELLHRGSQQFTDSAGLQNLEARLLAVCPDESKRDAERAVELATALYQRQNTPPHAETVGMALAAAGRFPEAVAWQKQLVESATEASVDETLLKRLSGNLQRYEAGFGAAVNWQ